MYKYEFTSHALKRLEKLPRNVQKRTIAKLDYYCKQENPLKFAEYLMDSRIGDYRFRIGDYRVIFDIQGTTLVVLSVGHRRDIYKKLR